MTGSSQKMVDDLRDRNSENLRSRRHSETTPRKLENGLKKHILRSCENSQFTERHEVSREPEVSPSETTRVAQPTQYSTIKDHSCDSLVDKHGPLSRDYILNDNNNDTRSSNNNIKGLDDVESIVKKEKTLSSDGCEVTEIKCTNSNMVTPKKRKLESVKDLYALTLDNHQLAKPKHVLNSKQKPTVDISGLELLSNSIEQLEHLKPETQNSTVSELEESPVKTKLISPQGESNNNNVDSPLGLLCALAEQRFMEEVGDKVPRRLNLDSSEEISHAGRLLLNLGRAKLSEKEKKITDKRKYVQADSENYESSKRFKMDGEFVGEESECDPLHYHENNNENKQYEGKVQNDVVYRTKEKTRRSIDFSEQNGVNTDDDEMAAFKDAPIARSSPRRDMDYERNTESYDQYERHYDQYQMNGTYSEKESAEANLSDSDTEMYNQKMSFDDRIDEEEDIGDVKRRRLSASEHRDCHDYRNLQAKLDAKKFIARKGHVDNEADWPNIDAMELDMRVRLADIQRQYKEKQRELSKLTPRKDEKKSPGRPRKKSHSSSSDHGPLASPPMLEPMSSPHKSPLQSPDGGSPSLTSSVLAMPRCNVNLVKLGEPRSHIKLLDSIPSIPISVPPVASPITVLPTSKASQDDDEKSTGRLGYDTSSPAPTVASSSSASKKRKVGRPRKLMCTSGSVRHLTETIVAKKPKSKSSLVSYLLSSKNRHLQTKYVSKTGYTPLPFKNGLSSIKSSKNHKSSKTKPKPAKQTPLHNKNVISSIIAEKAKLSQEVKLDKQNKMKPKLKAEAKVKTWEDDESNSVTENVLPESTVQEPVQEIPVDTTESIEKEVEKSRHEKSKKKKRKSSSSSPSRHKSSDRDKKESKRRKSLECKECKECAKAARAEKTMEIVNKCKLTSAHLAIDQLRVLTAMGGLFYAGRLSAVQAPDVYAITLDGERGNRPHIHSREEILRDAIVEVCPTSTKELPPGTRLCAYWSQQYRCLYPGTSVEPSEPDPELDEKFVSVEFDDGDSGRIALDDIRLLQPDYPVVEYDPNPLLSLGKRRRQTSVSTDDKRSSTNNQVSVSTTSNNAMHVVTSTTSCYVSSSDAQTLERHKSDDMDAKDLEEYRERKRLKKRRRDKLKRLQEAQEGKKKHKRHKCCEEHRKHKHRKHRKHKHRHSHHSSHSEGSHISSGESCCGQKSEEELPKEIAANIYQEEDEEEPFVPEDTIPEPIKEPIREEKPEKPKKADKKSKMRERQESVESRSKMAAFLPARQLWGWAGKGYRRPGAKGRAKKQFFRAIQRGNETIQIGDSAVFLSTGRPDRPYIGRIESMWETSSSNMIVKVKWFYHPEETVGCPKNLKYPGALFESPHMDENDVQTISHKCEVLPLQEYTEKLGKEPHRYVTIYDNNDIYYLAGYYDPTTYLLTMQPGVV